MKDYDTLEKKNQLLQKRILLQDTQLTRWYTCFYGSITNNGDEVNMYFYDGLKLKQLQYLSSFNDFNYT